MDTSRIQIMVTAIHATLAAPLVLVLTITNVCLAEPIRSTIHH